MMKVREALGPQTDRIQLRALIVGGVGVALCAVGLLLLAPTQFYQSYLWAYDYWLGISTGCIALILLNHVVGGTWGFVIRRPLEAGAKTVVLMALLFLPIVLGMKHIYPWDGASSENPVKLSGPKAQYLNEQWFLIRAAIYFVFWIGMAFVLNWWSEAQDRTTDQAPIRRLRAIGGPGLILMVISVTFASVDWLMSLEPDWFSTIYGLMVMMGQGLATFALITIVMALLSETEPYRDLVPIPQFNDLGNLLLTFTMLWAYASFSQYLIIWMGNLTEEIPWYFRRTHGGWQWIGRALIAFQFGLPFFVLLFRDLKRTPRLLIWVCVWVLIMHVLNDVWLVKPSFPGHEHLLHAFSWFDVAAFVAIGGLWVAAFVWFLKGKSLVPLHDPYMEGAEGNGGGH